MLQANDLPRSPAMSDHATRAISVADKVVALAEDGLRSIDRTIAAWPAEFRVIIWEAVADIASRRAAGARDYVGCPGLGEKS
jgi:hypothetical protein